MLGLSGLPVSRIGLGLAALGRPAYITLGRAQDLGTDRTVEAMEQRAHDVMAAAYDLGVRYFDAARSYGSAERFLASWLESRKPPRHEVTVGSKWGYRYVGGWRLDAEVNEVKDHSLAALRRQHAESRQILGEWLGLYQVHSATLDSGVLEDVEVLSELARLKSEGLVIGLTTSGPRQGEAVRRAMDVLVDGENPFSTVQATWNLLEPSVGSALGVAHQMGWGVLVKEALANGRLTGQGRIPAELARAAEARGSSPDQIALAAALSQPWASVVLSGAVTTDQIRSNIEASALSLSDSELGRLARLRESPQEYWAFRSTLGWR